MIHAFEIRFTGPAEADLDDLQNYLAREMSPRGVEAYLDRFFGFVSQLRHIPDRGTRRDEVRPGLRTIGFERRISIAFTVEENAVVILRVLYAGREIRLIDRPLPPTCDP